MNTSHTSTIGSGDESHHGSFPQSKEKSRFESFGTYTPERIVTTEELMGLMKHELPFPIDLERITGIKARRWRAEGETSVSIAVNAAKVCLKNSQYRAEDLDIVISTSISRTMEPSVHCLDPALSHFIKKEIGASNARNFDINNACAGMLTGAYLLDNMIRAGEVRNGMVVSGETITPIAETALREISDVLSEQFASLTVGDAGAAFIMDASPSEDEGIDFVKFLTLAEHAHLCIGRPSDVSAGPAMFTKSKEMHESGVIKIGSKFISDSVIKSGYKLDSYDYVITHQVAVGAIKSYLKAIGSHTGVTGLPTLTTVEDYGNTATTTLFLVLHNALREKKLQKGARILLVALASGIGVGTLSFTLGSLEV